MPASTADALAFGTLLRRHRLAAGLTQEALAERAGLSVRGISDLERGLRTAPHFATVERLAIALGLEAGDQETFAALARSATGARSVCTSPVPAALPVPPTPLIGREG